MEHSTKLHKLLAQANAAAETADDMTVADEPELGQLYADRAAIEIYIREKQRAIAMEKGLTPITDSEIQEVLHIIFQSSASDTKRGMVQKKARDKADVYSRILNFRINNEIAQSIPKRDELVRVFGENFSALAAPVGLKINQIIPRVRCLLEVATEVLALRAALSEAEAEIQDCHEQIEHSLGLSVPTKSTRGRRSKLGGCEVQDIARMKGQGLTNQAVLEIVNASRAEFGEPPIGLTAIKSIPASVAKQRISDQLTMPEPKAVFPDFGAPSSAAASRPIPPHIDELAYAEEQAIREVWGVTEERGNGFEQIGRYKPSRQVKLYEKQFLMWKEGLNL